MRVDTDLVRACAHMCILPERLSTLQKICCKGNEITYGVHAFRAPDVQQMRHLLSVKSDCSDITQRFQAVLCISFTAAAKPA